MASDAVLYEPEFASACRFMSECCIGPTMCPVSATRWHKMALAVRSPTYRGKMPVLSLWQRRANSRV